MRNDPKSLVERFYADAWNVRMKKRRVKSSMRS